MENTTQTFTIYRNSKLDRVFAAKQQARQILRAVGHFSYLGLEVIINGADELVTEFEKL